MTAPMNGEILRASREAGETGLLDWFTGTKAANTNIAPAGPDQLKRAILALNRDELPWHVRAGDGKADLIATWKFEDAYWRRELEKARMSNTIQMLMRLDVGNRTVRSVDREISVYWSAGLARLSVSIGAFRGQENEVGRSFVFGRKPDGKFGKLEEMQFSSSDFKTPIRQVVADNGWAWQGVVFAKL
jgi:hypothetical protein